jgi:DNA-binding MarR family transcriptional regulator
MAQALRRHADTGLVESPAWEAILRLLMAADRVRQRMNRACAAHGLTNGQYNVLRILREAQPNGCPRSEILQHMIEQSPDVTRLVDRLEARGLVERDRSDRDRRLSITRITPRGLDLLQRVEPEIESFYDWFRSRVTVEDCHAVSRICDGIQNSDA